MNNSPIKKKAYLVLYIAPTTGEIMEQVIIADHQFNGFVSRFQAALRRDPYMPLIMCIYDPASNYMMRYGNYNQKSKTN